MEGKHKERPPLSIEYAHLEKSHKYSEVSDVLENQSRNVVDTSTFRVAGFFSAFAVKTLMNPLHRVRTIMQCWREIFPHENIRPTIREIVSCELIRHSEESGYSRNVAGKHAKLYATVGKSVCRFLSSSRCLLGHLREPPPGNSNIAVRENSWDHWPGKSFGRIIYLPDH